MPNADTFSVPPIGDFVRRYLAASRLSVDPFARNSTLAHCRNDLNPATAATHHMEAMDFLTYCWRQKWRFDLAILDMPYSPRQISECYKAAGKSVGMRETQNARLYAEVKDAIVHLLTPDAVVLSFGWNSAGMGKKHKFEIVEIQLVSHGAAHNDTICLAERRL